MAQLKEQVAAQQKQIEQLLVAMAAQKTVLDRTLQAVESGRSAQAAPVERPDFAQMGGPLGGQVATLAPVIPSALRAGAYGAVDAAPALPPAAAPVTRSELLQTDKRVDELDKKMQGALKGLGGFKVSGDFRLRFDGTFRSSSVIPSPTPGGAPTLIPPLQNARGRYRVRLNVDKDLSDKFSAHLQLATGPINNTVTMDNEFGGTTVRNPFFISEAYADYHPTPKFSLRGGKMPEVFEDNSRFLFDPDLRFEGVQEVTRFSFSGNALGIKRVEFRAAQYVLTNPNTPIASAASPYVNAGFVAGKNVRDADLFHQGLAIFGDLKTGWSHQLFGDLQWYRNANQIALASTAAGFPVVVNPNIGISLSGPLTTGLGSATATAGGAIYTAPRFQIVRLSYRLRHDGWKIGERDVPAWIDFQGSRNVGTGFLRDAFMVSGNLGEVKKYGDVRLLYIYAIKDANGLISQLTDDDLGTNTGTNISTHLLDVDLGLSKFLQWQNLLFIQDERRPSNPRLNFFVPVPRGTSTQYRVQSQLLFTF